MKAFITSLFVITLGLTLFLHQRANQKINQNLKTNQRENATLACSLGISDYSGEYTLDKEYKSLSFGLELYKGDKLMKIMPFSSSSAGFAKLGREIQYSLKVFSDRAVSFKGCVEKGTSCKCGATGKTCKRVHLTINNSGTASGPILIPKNLLSGNTYIFKNLKSKIENGKIYLFNYAVYDWKKTQIKNGNGNLSIKELLKLNPKVNFMIGYVKVK